MTRSTRKSPRSPAPSILLMRDLRNEKSRRSLCGECEWMCRIDLNFFKEKKAWAYLSLPRGLLSSTAVKALPNCSL